MRVFISYSHENLDLTKVIIKVLTGIAAPMWDKDFRFGHGFHDQIKQFIAHAHVFLPVITEGSNKRGWVHQEIGYAMALNIPVLPIALLRDPGEMIQQIQAVRLQGDDEKSWEEQLRKQLTKEMLEMLVDEFSDQQFANYQCAEDAEDRAQLMVKYADDVHKLGYHGLVRQAGALSSFHIPSEPIGHPVWIQRYGPLRRGPFHCKWQRAERLALEKHARATGCRLIVNPKLSYKEYGRKAKIVRLEWLLKFLKSMPASKVAVALNHNLPMEKSVTLVGDWFSAEAVSAQIGQGYSHTIFTRHAPTVQRKAELFDQEFDECLKACKWSARNSKTQAEAELEKLIARLTRKRAKRRKGPEKRCKPALRREKRHPTL